jgi:hypothetical protein
MFEKDISPVVDDIRDFVMNNGVDPATDALNSQQF